MRDEIFMHWLSTLYRLGSHKQNQLLAHFESARSIFDAPVELLRTVHGITENNIRIITQNRDMDYLERSLRSLERIQASYISRHHRDFPYLLTEIPDPPVGLFCLGELPTFDSPTAAIIGSRRCTEYGLTISRQFAADLAKNGVTIISGMARGIDSCAHKGALEVSGHTIAILGCGVDVCYPAENRALRDDIMRTGCVLSEYPPGVEPLPHYFPARNRIISGLSQVVVVVEAGKRSGTQITVNQALEQGRDVMAVPGNITGKYSEGTNTLIKQGAGLASSSEDILHVLGKKPVKKASHTNDHIAPEEKLVYDVLAFDPVDPLSFDEIVIRTKSQPQTIQYILTMLEIKGYVQKLPGMRYIRQA